MTKLGSDYFTAKSAVTTNEGEIDDAEFASQIDMARDALARADRELIAKQAGAKLDEHIETMRRAISRRGGFEDRSGEGAADENGTIGAGNGQPWSGPRT